MTDNRVSKVNADEGPKVIVEVGERGPAGEQGPAGPTGLGRDLRDQWDLR